MVYSRMSINRHGLTTQQTKHIATFSYVPTILSAYYFANLSLNSSDEIEKYNSKR